MTLGQKQRQFTENVADLIHYAYMIGYELSFGDAFRDPRSHGAMGEQKGYGRANSCHKMRLAIDLNLFKDGVYLNKTEDHRELGEFWKTLHPDNRWGGDFSNPDGNHYSCEHNGFK